MTKLKDDLKWFAQNKAYIFALSLTAVCSYGFAIVQPSIGIDDTAVPLYLEDGLEVVMGRWTIFWLNKFFHVSDFAPFMTELIGVLFLMLAGTLFNVLFRRITHGRTGVIACTIFACAFVSNPIISEVFVYYWHDGAGLGYVLTALSLLSFYSGMESRGKDKLYSFGRSLLFVWAAVGCYESFLVLYILGILVVLFFWGMEDGKRLKLSSVSFYLFIGALLTILCVLLRSLMISITTAIFDLQGVLEQVKQEQRGLSEMAALFGEGGMDNLIMLVKRFWVVYHLNAVVYLPVTVYELAVFIFGAASVVMAVKKRNIWFPVLYAGMLFAPFLLTLAEMRLSYYRSCQYLPFFAAAGVWLLSNELLRIKWKDKKIKSKLYDEKLGKKLKLMRDKFIKCCVVLGAMILVWNQAEYMNRSFYTDYRKYETTREMLCSIAYEIERDYGKETPVIFTGHYSTPHELAEDYYVSYGSKQYQWIAVITDKVDPHLKEKYFSVWGYSFIGEANFSMIQWAFDAFDGTNREMMNFLKMHGHSFPLVTDPEIIAEANEIGDSMPGWPAEGSILQQDGYIIVHIMD